MKKRKALGKRQPSSDLVHIEWGLSPLSVEHAFVRGPGTYEGSLCGRAVFARSGGGRKCHYCVVEVEKRSLPDGRVDMSPTFAVDKIMRDRRSSPTPSRAAMIDPGMRAAR